MKTDKTIDVPATTHVVVDHYTCDLCGKTTKDADNWGGKSYAVDEVEVRMRTGSNYPEGGSSEATIFDICPDCFKTKLTPWLQSQGAKFRTEESDW